MPGSGSNLDEFDIAAEYEDLLLQLVAQADQLSPPSRDSQTPTINYDPIPSTATHGRTLAVAVQSSKPISPPSADLDHRSLGGINYPSLDKLREEYRGDSVHLIPARSSEPAEPTDIPKRRRRSKNKEETDPGPSSQSETHPEPTEKSEKPRRGRPRRDKDGEESGTDAASTPGSSPKQAEQTAEQKRKRRSKSKEDPENDNKSPLERFRTYPKKPLSVSDLTSGQWCELQYEYTLTLLPFGKKTRTDAMKGGSKVHKKLEEEQGELVVIKSETLEDSFGIRLWNIIQGLGRLRDSGRTREFEVWGLVDGNLVNGVIDEVIFLDEPDPSQDEGPELKAPGQTKITDHYPTNSASMEANPPKRMAYLKDVKTRGTNRLPTGPVIRPTVVQLYLYQRFLADMAAGNIDFFKIFKRYSVDPDVAFSDSFIAQMVNIYGDTFFATLSSQDEASPVLPVDGFFKGQSLRTFVPLLKSELEKTFPHGAQSIADVATVEYRSRDSEEVLGTTPILLEESIGAQVSSYMEWWRGDREALGVPIEEAFKCRTCQFVDSCAWREKMDTEILEKAMEKIHRAAAEKTDQE